MYQGQPIETLSVVLGEEEVPIKQVRRPEGWSYEMKMGRQKIWLDPIEYGILTFLAKRPYHAYTRARIAKGVSTDKHPLLEEAVDAHVASLREKLGFYRDYIQTVPHTGYRFKE